MINILEKKNCCGCTACASICIHNAIIMEPDELGFLYPKVDTTKCRDCGLCDKVCSFNEHYDKSDVFSEPIAYAARHKNVNEVMHSRSGAVFVALSDSILENDGIVYGAGYSNHFHVVHKRASNKEARNEFRGSKYVQSDMRGVFIQVKEDLLKGESVLFSGTPCQTAALKGYLNPQLRENLVLVDIVCHGVPSPNIWSDYINYIESKECSKIISVDFRDKELFGWSAHRESFKFLSSNNYQKCTDYRWFSVFFDKNILLRDSCSNCHFCNTHRPSDITIADYWGWESLNSDLNQDNKGLNLVLINTQKGERFFENIKQHLYLLSATKDSYLQPNLVNPTIFHSKRKKFESDYKKYGFEYVFHHKYREPISKKWLISKVKRIINLIIKRQR